MANCQIKNLLISESIVSNSGLLYAQKRPEIIANTLSFQYKNYCLMDGLKKLTFNGVKWYLIGDGANIIANFIIGIILARLLTPTDFGTVGVYGIFFAIANIFINGGFSMSLIQKKITNDVDCSTAFWSNIIVGIACFSVFYFTAPLIAEFFNIDILTSIIRLSALGLLVGSFTVVQTTLFNKRVDFKTTSLIRLIANIIAGATCVYFAYKGAGVWSLIIQGLTSTIITTILLWSVSSWRPLFIFSWNSFRELFGFGGKILGTRLLDCCSGQGAAFVLGKFFSPGDLGYYQKGVAYARLLSSTLANALFGVSFPVLAKIDDEEKLIYIFRQYLRITSMSIFFFMLLLFILAHPIIILLYTSKWSMSANLMQISIWALMFDPIVGINNSIFNVKRRGDILLKLQIYKTLILLTLIILSIPFGVYAVCFAEVIYYQIAIFLCGYQTKKIINYGYKEQIKDIMPYLFIAVISVTPAFLFTLTSLPNILIIFLGGISSGIMYLVLLYKKKDSVFIQYIWNNSEICKYRSKILKRD